MTRKALLVVVLALAAIAPVRNYDFFWHLATGRWIAEHHALPLTDPFAIASDRVPWINGEWLFEIALYALYSVVGLAAMSVLRGLLAAAVFAEASPFAILAFAGAMPVFDLRPSSVAALFVMLAIRARSWIAFAVLTALWINVHPSALLAPLIALLITRNAKTTAASAIALLANPYGIHGILAPLRLMLFAGGGTFVNAEWLPSAPFVFPLLYVCIVVAIVVFTMNKERDWFRIALLALFAYLAIAHVRNQPLFFAAFPMLVRMELKPLFRYASYAAVALVAITTNHHLGVLEHRFPIASVASLQSRGLRGNVYNPDQFGGYLIWAFYPERRTLTDGRNELYHAYIPEYARARNDGRAWNALLRKYKIDLAVDEHHAPLDVLDAVTRQKTKMPAEDAYWPREQWALIARDDVSMVFARRAAFAGIERFELKR